MPNQTMKVLLASKFIKVYFANLNNAQHKLLDAVLADVPGNVMIEEGAYLITGKSEQLYKALYALCNSFSIELI